MFIGPDGEDLTQQEWEDLWLARMASSNVPESWWRKQTHIGDICVSTVWTGINYQWNEYDPPLVWETMVFGGDFDQHEWRHTSRAAAWDAHEDIVRQLKASSRR
jgi:hypothetical protein